MPTRVLSFFLLTVLASGLSPARAQNGVPDDRVGRLVLFILAGQSNMSGRGELPSEQTIHPHVYVFGNDYRWRLATEPVDSPAGQVDSVSVDANAGFSPELAFALRMLEHDSSAVIGLIPCAKGATIIEQWQRNLSDASLYGSCLKRALAASPMGSLKGMLFFQGESDAHHGELYQGVRRYPDEWAEKFSSFVNDFRTDLRLPDLPVVFAQIGPHASPERYVNWEVVQARQAGVQIERVAMIRTADLSLQDRVHFDPPSYRIIGRRFADRMMDLLDKKEIDLQGHRGARGLLPENTIPAFRRALDVGVTTLEMDAVISSDKKVVVSHDPWMSSTICRTPEGLDIDRAEERTHNLYRLTYDEIARYDCGSRGHPGFPHQEAMRAGKPLLKDVIEMAESYAGDHGLPPPRYNVEIKSDPEFDGLFHPPPDEYARLLYDVLEQHDVLDRVTIQSFDPRALAASKAIDPNVSLALLVDNLRGFVRNVRGLGFLPDIYSPNFRLVSRSMIDRAHELGVQVLPWTVNDAQDMRRLLEIGVDGLITDYPDVGREVVDVFQGSLR